MTQESVVISRFYSALIKERNIEDTGEIFISIPVTFTIAKKIKKAAMSISLSSGFSNINLLNN